MNAPMSTHRLPGLAMGLALAFLFGSVATPAREGYFEQYCATAGCHGGTSPSGSPADSPSCAACHYHGMREVNKRWKKAQAFRGWTDRTVYEAGQTMRIFVTGGDQPGWVRVRILDHEGQEVARATGPTGMGDDMQPNWTASVLPGPIVLTARAPIVPGRYTWTVGWFGNVARPNPPAVLEGQTVIAHRAFVLDWHDVPLPPFDVDSSDSKGPTVTGLTVTTSPTNGARQIRVSALASDGVLKATAVGQARSRITGGSLGSGGAWQPMEAADGAFDASDEEVTAVLEVGDLAPGPYSAVVQAADVVGNWGPQVPSVLLVTPPPPGDQLPPAASCWTPKPSLVPPGQPVRLRAIIDDLASGGSPIHGAEAFVSAPGQDGAGLILEPADGLLDSASELMTGLFPTDGLPDGEYPVLIHGADGTGLWGGYCESLVQVQKAADVTPPVVSSVKANPRPTMGAAVASIHAMASDSESGYGDITAAEYFLDPGTPPGGGVPMQPQDGAFDSQNERVTGALDVTGWEPRAYLIGVRARDDAGWWSAAAWGSLQVSMDGEDRAGPQVLGLRLSPPFTDGAGETILSGRVDDSMTGASRPVLVEYYLGQPGLAGSGVPVVPRAGRPGSARRRPGPVARFRTAIPVSGLPRDQPFTVYVRGMDELGNWGSMAAAAFRVTGAH